MIHLSHHSLYFVFDSLNDCHYTDTLLKLGPEAYLWHELKPTGKAHILLSVTAPAPGGQLQVRTFDSASTEFLMLQNNLFLTTKKLPDAILKDSTAQAHCHSFSQLNRSGDFLTWLGACAEKNKGRSIALLIAYDAFASIQGTGDVNALPSNCTTLIRLPAEAGKLAQGLLGNRALRQAFPQLEDSLGGSQEPLMSALSRRLGDQMLCLFQQEQDVRNLLLRQAVVDPEGTDSVEQLRDQAACLHLLRRHRRLHLLHSRYSDPAQIVPLSTLSADWKNYRKALGDLARAQRAACPNGSMEDALAAQGLIPTPSSAAGSPPFCHPVYTGVLTRDLYHLQELLRGRNVPADLRAVDFREILKLTTLWNRPRNSQIMAYVQAFCDGACSAVGDGQWDIVQDMLLLLQFCAEQVCAQDSQNCSLSHVLSLGSEILTLARNMAAADRIDRYLHYNAAPAALQNFAAYSQKVHDTVAREHLTYEQAVLFTKRSMLRLKISRFHEHGVTPEQLAADLAQIQASYDQATSQGMYLRTPVRPEPAAQTTPQPPASGQAASHEDHSRAWQKVLQDHYIPESVPPPEEDDDLDYEEVEDAK